MTILSAISNLWLVFVGYGFAKGFEWYWLALWTLFSVISFEIRDRELISMAVKIAQKESDVVIGQIKGVETNERQAG